MRKEEERGERRALKTASDAQGRGARAITRAITRRVFFSANNPSSQPTTAGCGQAFLTPTRGASATGTGAGKDYTSSSKDYTSSSAPGLAGAGGRPASKDKHDSKDADADVCEEALVMLMLTYTADGGQAAHRPGLPSRSAGSPWHLDACLHLGSISVWHQEEALNTMAQLVAPVAALYWRHAGARRSPHALASASPVLTSVEKTDSDTCAPAAPEAARQGGEPSELVRRLMWERLTGTMSCSVKSGDMRFHSLSLAGEAAQDSIAVAARIQLSATLSDCLSPFPSSMRKPDGPAAAGSQGRQGSESSLSKTLLLGAQLRDVTMTCCTAPLPTFSAKPAPPSGRRPLPLQRTQGRQSKVDREEAEGRQSHVEEEVLLVPDFEARLSLSSSPARAGTGSRAQGEAVFGQAAAGAGVGRTAGTASMGGLDACAMPSQASKASPEIPDPPAGAGSRGLEVEVHVRLGAGVVARISVAHLKRLVAIWLASAASLEAAASLASALRHSPVDHKTDDTEPYQSAQDAGVGVGVSVATRAGGGGGEAKGQLFSQLDGPAAASTSACSPRRAVSGVGPHAWTTLLLTALRSASFKAETMRLVFEECRHGGALGFLRLPLFSCRVEV